MALLAQLAPVPRQRVDTNLGVVAAGAKLHTYAAGTLFNLPTFSDAALSVPNTNPLTASASGLFGPIYLSPAVSYRFLLNQSDDSTLIWDQDNILAPGTSIQVDTTTLIGTQNNLTVGVGCVLLKCNNASELVINGIAWPALQVPTDGQLLTVMSVGAGNVRLAYESVNSTNGTRLHNYVTSNDTWLAAGKGVAVYQYDTSILRWRMVAHEQGDWITPAFGSGAFTASTGNWTVAAGDVSVQAFYLKGRELLIAVNLVTTTISATPTSLIQQIPGGYTVPGSIAALLTTYIGNPAGVVTACRAQIVGSFISYFPTIAGTGNWTTVTDTCAIAGMFSCIAT